MGGYTVSKTLTPHILLQMIHLAAISEGGKLHLFSSPFESEGKKPVNALCTVQFVSNASEVSGPPLLNNNNLSMLTSIMFCCLNTPSSPPSPLPLLHSPSSLPLLSPPLPLLSLNHQSTTPSCLPVLAAKLVSSQVSVAHTSLIRPTFESIVRSLHPPEHGCFM